MFFFLFITLYMKLNTFNTGGGGGGGDSPIKMTGMLVGHFEKTP